MFKKNIQSIAATILSVLCTLILAHTALAADPKYQPMVAIPGFNDQNNRSLSEYVNLIYMTLVAVGALLALVKISIAGAKYMMSDVVTSKGEAKSDIKGALLGLAILVIPYIVLNTIYSGLTNTNVLDGNSPKATLQQTGQPPGTTRSVCSFKGSDKSECYVGTKGCRTDLDGGFVVTNDTSGQCTYIP